MSLNPVLRIGFQITETLFMHQDISKEAARARATELLKMVGISDPERRLEQYPHQFSGGMRQRVMIAIGLACDPRLIIADEPTTALDVTIQAQILKLMKDLSRRPRHRHGDHHPQSRRGRPLRRSGERDVCGEDGRAGHGRADLPSPAPSLHARPPALGAAARPAARRQARDHRGPAAQPARPAAGLPLRRRAATRSRTAAARSSRTCSDRAGAALPLPPLARDRGEGRGGARARGRGGQGAAAEDPRSRPSAPRGRQTQDLLRGWRRLSALGRREGHGARRRRGLLRHLQGRDAGPGRRVGLRQDHNRSHDPAPGGADRTARSASGTRTWQRCPATR